MKKQPLISVICPSYNSENTIEETLISVFKQTYRNWEIIVVDGGSTDATKTIVLDFKKQKRNIRFETFLEESGPGPAREYAISIANGDYFAFIDADDLWNESKLDLQLTFMLQRKILFSYTKYNLLDDSGVRKSGPILWKNYDYYSYFRKRGIANSSVIIKKDLFYQIPSKPHYSGFAEDTALWLRLMQTGYKAYLYPEELFTYRNSREARSRKVFKNALAVIFIYKNLFKKSYFQIFYLYPLYILDVLLRSRCKRFMMFFMPTSFE